MRAIMRAQKREGFGFGRREVFSIPWSSPSSFPVPINSICRNWVRANGGKYCPDILLQMQAVRAAVKAVEGSILKRHLGHCVQSAFSASNKKERKDKIEELLKLYSK